MITLTQAIYVEKFCTGLLYIAQKLDPWLTFIPGIQYRMDISSDNLYSASIALDQYKRIDCLFDATLRYRIQMCDTISANAMLAYAVSDNIFIRF